MPTIYWALPGDKSCVQIERNASTVIGTAILETFYPDKFQEMSKPVEEREAFKNWVKSAGGNVVKVQTPPDGYIYNSELEYFYATESKQWHCFTRYLPPHYYIPKATDSTKGVPHALIRHPVERFLSLIHRHTVELHTYTEGFDITRRLDEICLSLEQTLPNEPFIYNNKAFYKQVALLDNNFIGIKFYKFTDHFNDFVSNIGLPAPLPKKSLKRLQDFKLEPVHEELIISRYKDDLELYNSIRYPGIVLQV